MTDLSTPVARSCLKKVSWRLLPLLFAMYVIAYLDRANASFAKLQMKDALGFSEDVFGLGFGLFFIGYMVFEIPGALFVEHWSARKWFSRILITWGACSMCTALVTTKSEFYWARFLLGVAEAGFFPGVIVYYTHWFPREVRSRAMSAMLIGVPASLAFGAFASALILKLDALGLQGWQWVFIIEGAPAVLLGVAVPFLLSDKPKDANWLTTEEREWLERTLESERQATVASGGAKSLRDAVRHPAVWLLAVGIFFTNLGGYGVVYWLATTVKGFLGNPDAPADNTDVLLWTAPVFLVGIPGVLLSGWLSTRGGRWKQYCVAAQISSGLFLTLSAIPDQPWATRYACLLCVGFFAHSWFTPYWSLPSLALTSSAAAASIGFINMFGNIPGYLANHAMGEMKAAGASDMTCMLFLAGGFLAGAVFVSLLRIRHKPNAS
jgi:ACS family tartrate transporter-like MFS transporter